MKNIKKISTIIILTILLAFSGTLFGCQNLYSNIELELSVEEVTINLTDEPENTEETADNTEETTDSTEETTDNTEETTDNTEENTDATAEDEIIVGPNQAKFTTLIKNKPDEVSNNLLVNQTTAGVVAVEQVDKDNETNETTFLITALRGGSTTLIIKTVEGDKTIELPVTVIQEITDLEANADYSPAIIAGETSSINTARALEFFPATTNQKEVIYSLIDNAEGIEVSESGFVTVNTKTTDYITVRATSKANEQIYTNLTVRVIEPIIKENINLQVNEQITNSVTLATNIIDGSQAVYQINVEENSEPLNVVLNVNTNNNLDIERLGNKEFLFRSIELGNATLTAKVEVIGYEDYFITKQFDVNILEYPTYVSVNSTRGILQNEQIFDNYVNALGTPYNLRVGTIGAYNKQMKLLISEEDQAKIEIRYSDGTLINKKQDGTLINVEDVILPNNITIYIKAKADEQLNFEQDITMQVASYATLENENIVATTINMNLTRGAESLQLLTNENLSIEVGDQVNIDFEASPVDASLGEVSLFVMNSDIVSYVKNSNNQFAVTAKKPGNTIVTLVSSNGINKDVNIHVYASLTDVTLTMQTPEQNANIATLSQKLTDENKQTISSATIAIGSGIAVNVNEHPIDASIVSVYYTTENANIATISTSGYIIAKNIGTTTITVEVGRNTNLGNGESEVDYIQRTFELTVYMPISSVELNYYQYELFDANTLGYYEMDKSTLQLELNINPINATFNTDQINWSVNSSYATVDNTGFIQASLPAEINSAVVTVSATINEYGRYYTQKCSITVRKPVKVQGISALNVQDYLYFDARNGLGEENEDTASFKIDAQTYPVNASNSKLIYRYVQAPGDGNPEPIVIVKQDGTIIPNRAGEYASIHIIAEDSYTSSNNYENFVVIDVRVADGLTEETAIELRSAQDLMNINTQEGLTLNYVISRTIDLSNVDLTPIGTIDNAEVGFSGVINGDFTYSNYNMQNQIIGANFNISSTDRNNNIGLFSLLKGATIKNLTFKVNNFDTTLSSNASSTNSNIGVLTAKAENSVIDNVKLELLSSNIRIANRQNNIGVMAGYIDNNSNIENSKTWGDLYVSTMAQASVEPVVNIGGMVGYNEGTVSANFDVANDTLLQNYSKFNSRVNISIHNMQNLNSAFGGIVGYNTGFVQNILVKANVTGINNVGGAIGINTSIVENVLSASYVTGNSIVGGLIGSDSGTVSNSLVLALDEFELNQVVQPQIKAQNVVGGLIGYATGSTVSYSYARSFYSRTIDNNLYYGDLVIDIDDGYNQPIYVGGLIGYARGADLNSVYSQLNISIIDNYETNVTVYAGGIIGANEGVFTLQNAYVKGNLIAQSASYAGGISGNILNSNSSINKAYIMLNIIAANSDAILGNVFNTPTTNNILYLDTIGTSSYGTSATLTELETLSTYTNKNFGFVSLGGTPFAFDENYNNSNPFIVYEDNTTRMLIQAPTALYVTVNDGIEQASEVKNNHLKLDNQKAVVYYYQNATEALNTYSVDNDLGIYGNPIISKTFTPTTANIELVNFVSSDNSIARVTDDGLLKVYQTGSVTITMYSILDRNVFAEFELAVVKPITMFSLYEENLLDDGFSELEQAQNLNASTIKVDNLKRLYPNISAIVEQQEYAKNNLVYINYQAQNEVGVSFNSYNWNYNNGLYSVTIPSSEAQVLRGDFVNYDVNNKPVAFDLSAVPVLRVQYESGEFDLPLNFLQKQFNIKVVEGSTNLQLSSNESNISLKDLFIVDVELETDTPYPITEPNTSVIDIESIKRVDGLNNIDADNELVINKISRRIEANTIYERYQIQVADRYNKDLYSEKQTYKINFASYDKSINAVKLNDAVVSLQNELTLHVIPQDTLRMDMSYYSSNEVFEYNNETYYNPNELPSTSITAGRIGLLKLGVYPEFANVDYVDLKYQTNENFTFSMQQVAFTSVEDQVGYTAIHPQAELIQNGIRLRLISNEDEFGNYSYDGNLYVRALIASGVTTNTNFTLTATAYSINSSDQVVEGLTSSLTLTAKPSSQLQVYYKGSSEEGYFAVGTEQYITVAATRLDINEDDINWVTTNIDENNITFEGKVQEQHIVYYTYKIETNISNFTEQVTIQAKVERIINNNVEQYSSNLLTLVPALFTIESISVENVNTQNDYFSVAYGGVYPLRVIINAQYDTSAPNVDDIKQQISILEDEFSSAISNEGQQSTVSTWYKRQFRASGIEDQALLAGYDSYINYLINENVVQDDYNEVNIQPKRVSSNDVIVAKIQFSYDYNSNNYAGIPTAHLGNLTYTEPGVDNLNRTTIESQFRTNFYLRADDERPIPVYNEEDLLAMQENVSYILMQDITVGEVSPWEPLDTAVKSLDGNGYTISIKEFDTHNLEDIDVPTSKNFGLFSYITNETTLKNLTVDLTNVTIDVSLYEHVNFGGLVAVNNSGMIYNSYTKSSKETGNLGVELILSPTVNNVNTSANIGGITALNSGYITNSRSDLALKANKGYMAGISAENSGTITSSYYKNGFIENTAQAKQSSAVGGLVVTNSANAKIAYSYVEGRSSALETGDTGRMIGGGLEFSGDLAGFVYENLGTIKDSYSNIKITSQSRSSGFVFNNSGIIKNAYSMSKVAYNVAAHTPFTGTSEQGNPLNTGTITSSYYLDGDFAGKALEIAIKTSLIYWDNKSTFTQFSFSKEPNSPEYGVWQMKDIQNTGVMTPSLVSADHIAKSVRILDSVTVDDQTNEVIYEYIDDENYVEGTEDNPLIIQNSTQFNNILTEQKTEEVGEQNDLFNQHVRIIKDFSFNSDEISKPSSTDFAGVLDGNDMSITNINVITTNQINNNKVGLFRSITTNNDNVGTIKNLNLTFDQVFANDNTNVGALAGEIKSGIIYNLNIDNQSTVVQGRNLVGGVAGKITGNTHLVNIKVKTSVNSGYRESVNPSVAYDIYDSNNDNDEIISYAGAVAGVLDVTHNSVIENISVYGKSSVISENAGGVFGLVGESTTVNNVSFEVNSDQIIRTTKVAGGIVAENRGSINNGIISHKSDVQQLIDNNILNNNYGEHLQNQNINLFAGIGQIAGGLIGFNNGGSVYNSTAKVDVRNSNILIAGGLIGRVVGGSIGTSYAYGSVLANQAVGGLIGSIADKSLIIAATGPVKQEYANNISDYDTIINNSTSYNNWLNTDHNILVNGYSNNKKIVIGGLVGVIQLTDQENYFVSTNKETNSYINSLYSPQNYLPSSDWYIMNEYGLMNESLGFLYSDSNKLYQVPSDYDYTNGEPITYGEDTITPYYNNDNEIAEGVKVFDLYQ